MQNKNVAKNRSQSPKTLREQMHHQSELLISDIKGTIKKQSHGYLDMLIDWAIDKALNAAKRKLSA